MNGGGGRCSRRTCGRSWSGRQLRKRAKRARDVIVNSFCYSSCWASHFTGPPFECSPIPAEKVGPHPSEEGRGLQPRFQVEERERGEEGRGKGGGRQERTRTETDPGDLVTCDRRNVRWAGPSNSALAPAFTRAEPQLMLGRLYKR